jgi:hypothetical protein
MKTRSAVMALVGIRAACRSGMTRLAARPRRSSRTAAPIGCPGGAHGARSVAMPARGLWLALAAILAWAGLGGSASAAAPSGPRAAGDGGDYCASPAVTAAWPADGRTIRVSPGQSIQAAVNAAAGGDTVELADGNYGAQSVSVAKPIRLMAAHRHGAILEGQATEPSHANAGGTGTGVRVSGAGAMVDGLYLRWHATAISVKGGPATIQNNRVQSPSSAGIQIYDARSPLVRCNWVLDPYLPTDPKSQSPATAPAISEAQADYGVNCYGCRDPRIIHNYFNGIFNQTLSFKEGNVNAVASDNTFEGSKLTALFFGQNRPHNGPYKTTGLPTGPDVGSIVAERNVFRSARDARGVYYMRSPIRVWHVRGAVRLADNVVESAEQGVLIECKRSGDAGCVGDDSGASQSTVTMAGNVIGGAVMDGTSRYQVNRAGCVRAWTGITPPRVTTSVSDQLCIATPRAVSVASDGYNGAPAISNAGIRNMAGPISTLRAAVPATSPDLSYGARARSEP